MIWYLSITTWKGLVWDAEHFYGRIKPDAGALGLDNPNNVPKAIKEYDLDRDYIGADELVHRSIQFATERAVRAAAKKWFKKRARPGDVLLQSSHSSLDPVRPLAYYGKPSIYRRARALWRAYEAIDGWEMDEGMAQKLCDLWEDLWREKP